MKINEAVIKQYVVGYRFNKPAVLWFDVSNYKEIVGENSTTVSFEEEGETYVYTGNSTKGYAEANNKAPYITSYELIDEEEVLKRDLISQFGNVIADEDEYDDFEDKDDEDPYDYDDWDNHCGHRYTCGGGYHHCGSYGGCGGYGGGC